MSATKLLAAQQNDSSDLKAAISHALYQNNLDSNIMLPATVVSYDRANNIATIKPIIAIVDVDGTVRSRESFTNIPVLALGGGGFMINFPLSVGDLGWIVAADRDMTLYKQQLTEQRPNTSRTRDFSDGMFIPDVMRKYTIAAEDEGGMVIQSLDGATKLSMNDGTIIVAAPAGMVVRTPLAHFSQAITVEGLATFNGGVTGKAGTAVTLPATTTINGITVATHGHTQQNNGSGRTASGMIS